MKWEWSFSFANPPIRDDARAVDASVQCCQRTYIVVGTVEVFV